MTSSSGPTATSPIDSHDERTTAALALGALLASTADPLRASETLLDYLCSPDSKRQRALEETGIRATVVDDFRSLLPSDPPSLSTAMSCGAFWALGRRAGAPSPAWWSPVVSGTDLDPAVFDRRTGETLVALIARARSRVRLFSAYVDVGGLLALAPALAGAARRGALLDVVSVRRLERGDGATERLREHVEAHADASRLRIHRLEGMEWFPHLKLVTVDGSHAYIGSANVTFAGLTTNFEVGAIVEGDAVVAYELLVDELVGRVEQPRPVDVPADPA